MRGRDRRIARAQERRAQQRRRRLVLLGIGAGAAVVALAVAAIWLLGPDPRADGGELTRSGSRALAPDEAGPALGHQDVPTSFRVTYRIEHREGVTRHEEVTVRRPFDARTVERTEPDGGEVVGVRESSIGRFAIKGAEGEDTVVMAQGAVLAAGDLRLDPVLDLALDRDLLERREQREVGDRVCQVYRSGGSVLAGRLSPATEDEYADACFDDSGLLLEEWWVLDGRPLRHRLALEVEVEPDLDAAEPLDQLPAEPSIPAEAGGGAFRRIRDDSFPPDTHYELPAAPTGFDRVGRFLVVPTQPGAFDETGDRTEVVAGVTDVWVRGADFVAVEQGGTLGQVDAFGRSEGADEVDVGAWVTEREGEAELLISLVTTEVRIRLPLGRFVRVMGTLPPDDLLELARTLVPVEGGELVFDDLDDLGGADADGADADGADDRGTDDGGA